MSRDKDMPMSRDTLCTCPEPEHCQPDNGETSGHWRGLNLRFGGSGFFLWVGGLVVAGGGNGEFADDLAAVGVDDGAVVVVDKPSMVTQVPLETRPVPFTGPLGMCKDSVGQDFSPGPPNTMARSPVPVGIRRGLPPRAGPAWEPARSA